MSMDKIYKTEKTLQGSFIPEKTVKIRWEKSSIFYGMQLSYYDGVHQSIFNITMQLFLE